MIDPKLLALLVCPDNHTELHLADPDLMDRVNQAIAAGKLKDRGGELVEGPVEGGLVREDGKVLYLIKDGIPVMLVERSLTLDGIR